MIWMTRPHYFANLITLLLRIHAQKPTTFYSIVYCGTAKLVRETSTLNSYNTSTTFRFFFTRRIFAIELNLLMYMFWTWKATLISCLVSLHVLLLIFAHYCCFLPVLDVWDGVEAHWVSVSVNCAWLKSLQGQFVVLSCCTLKTECNMLISLWLSWLTNEPTTRRPQRTGKLQMKKEIFSQFFLSNCWTLESHWPLFSWQIQWHLVQRRIGSLKKI